MGIEMYLVRPDESCQIAIKKIMRKEIVNGFKNTITYTSHCNVLENESKGIR